MAGPTLKLSVNGSGKDTIDGLNASIEKLKGNLASLKVLKPDLSSLESLTAEFQKFRTSFLEIAQGQKTAFAEMAEAIKGGLGKAAQAARTGAEELDKALAKGGTDGKSGIPAFKAKLMVGAAALEEAAREASAKQSTALFAWQAKLQVGSLAIKEAQEKAADAAASGASAWQAKLQVGSLKIAESMEKAAATEASAQAAWVAKMQTGSLKIAEEIAAAAEREVQALAKAAERIKLAEAAYQAASPRTQLGTTVRARAQLEGGVSTAAVTESLGPTAVNAAKAAASFEELYQKHLNWTNGAKEGVAPVRSLHGAISDLHGGVRGLADGFGQALPIFASIGAFMAGAALSGAFVQTVKMGSEVAHILEVIGSLGGNTASEVQQVKEALLDLGAKGPFGPLEIAGALKTLSLAGLNAKEQLAGIKDVLNFSIASGGGLSPDESAKSLVALGTAFGYTADGFGRVGDVISKAAAISMSDVADFTAAMRTASVVSTLYGVSLENVATQVAELAQIGIRGGAAGTAIRNFYQVISSDTKRVNDALSVLGVSVRNQSGELKGQVKDYVQLIAEIDGALKKYDPKGQADAIAKLTNNRSSKDLVTGLEAYRKAAAERGPDETAQLKQLESFKKQVVESYGFMGIAAANLAVTAKNQMLSVVSSFQTSLVSAFDSVEPTVIVISARLREAFGSEAFRGAIRDLATAVGNFTVTVVEHAQAIKIGVEAWLAYKAVVIGFTVLSQVAVIIRSVTAAVEGLALAQTAVAAAGAASLPWLARAAALLGPLGALLGAAAALWLIFGDNSVKASVTAATASELATNDIIKNLDDQSAALIKKNALMAAGVSVQQAEMLSAQEAAKEKIAMQREAERGVLAEKVLHEQTARDYYASLPAAATPGYRRDRVGGGLLKAPDPKELESALAALQDFDARTAEATTRMENSITRFQQLSKENADRIAAAMKAALPQAGGKPFVIPTTETPGSQAASLKTQFDERNKTIKEQFTFEQQLEDARHKKQLVGDTLYALETEDIAKRQYDAQTALLEEYRAKVTPLLAQMRTAGKGAKADTRETGLEEMLKQLDQELDKRTKLAKINDVGTGNVAARATEAALAALESGVNLQQKLLDTKLAYDALLPEEQAFMTARNTEAEKYLTLTQKAQQLLKDAQRDLGGLPENSPLAAQLQAKIKDLEAQLAAITKARDTQADRAGAIAASGVVPAWKKNLDEWANATRSMQRYWDETVQGTIDKGRTIWDNFVKTGKLSFGSIVDFVRDQMSKAVYEQMIAPYFASLGKSIANLTLGKRPGGDLKGGPDTAAKGEDWGTTMRNKAIEVWDSVSVAVSPLIDTFKNFGSGLWTLLQELISWGQTLLTSQGGGSGGGVLGAIMGLFGGGSSYGGFAAGSTDAGGISTPQAGFAKGDVFGEPTMFRFAMGGGFGHGVMGEAGPEAVMPLKRGSNGSLGVVNHAGGGGGGSPVKVIINAPPGVTVRQEESSDSDGHKLELWLDMAEKRSVAAVSKSIGTGGGQVASALKGRGVNLNANLARRS